MTCVVEAEARVIVSLKMCFTVANSLNQRLYAFLLAENSKNHIWKTALQLYSGKRSSLEGTGLNGAVLSSVVFFLLESPIS